MLEEKLRMTIEQFYFKLLEEFKSKFIVRIN